MSETVQKLGQQIHRNVQSRLNELAAYHVTAGDTLNEIIRKYYGISLGDPRHKMALSQIVYLNPQIKDPNLIYVNQWIRLPALPRQEDPRPYCAIGDDAFLNIPYDENSALSLHLKGHSLDRLSAFVPQRQTERDLFWALSWLHQNYDYLSVAAGAGMNTWGNLVAQGNQAFIAEVKSLYQMYKSGILSKGQYDYRRRQALKKFSELLGPFEKFLLKGKTSTEAIRIANTRALPATAKIDQHLSRLARMAKLASNGGLLLTGVGVGMGCYNMAQVTSKHEKNEIFVETVSSSVAGLASSLGLTLMLASNPVGWGVALVLGTSAAIGSYVAGKGAVMFYNRFSHQYDFASASGVNALCR